MCLNCGSDKQLKISPDFCSLSCLAEYRKTKGYCGSCKTTKELQEMRVSKGKIKGICKECHRKNERKRWNNKPKEVRQDISRQYQENFNKRRQEGHYEEEELIRMWCLRNIRRKDLKGSRERVNLSMNRLKDLCTEAKQIFPYISFNNFEKLGNKWSWSSIDRIDPTLGYTDNNIVVVPLWLNSAKLDTTYNHLLELIAQLPEGYLKSL